MKATTALCVVILSCTIAAIYAQEINPSWNRQVFRSDEIRPQATGKVERFMLESTPRPHGDIVIRALHFRLVSADKHKPIPIQNIYFHHIRLSDTNGTYMAAIGAEAAQTPIILPEPYGIYSDGELGWQLETLLLDLYDLIAGGHTLVKVEYQVWWTTTRVPHERVVLTHMDASGYANNAHVHYAVPGDGPEGSIHEQTMRFTWNNLPNMTLVYGIGHVHHGATDVTLYDVTGGDRTVICRTEPVEDSFGYVVRMTACYPGARGTIERGHSFELVARYRNDRPMADAMGFLCGFAKLLEPMDGYDLLPWARPRNVTYDANCLPGHGCHEEEQQHQHK